MALAEAAAAGAVAAAVAWVEVSDPAGCSGGGGGMGSFFGGGTNSNRRFNLTFSVNARNIFNEVNLGTRVGVVGSRLFDQSNSIGGLFGGGGGGGFQAANRRIDIQAIFTF